MSQNLTFWSQFRSSKSSIFVDFLSVFSFFCKLEKYTKPSCGLSILTKMLTFLVKQRSDSLRRKVFCFFQNLVYFVDFCLNFGKWFASKVMDFVYFLHQLPACHRGFDFVDLDECLTFDSMKTYNFWYNFELDCKIKDLCSNGDITQCVPIHNK